jgi:hypothetical protein
MNTNQNNDLDKKLNNKTCCICLEEETENDIENDNKLVEYNHCGKYYIHNKCLNNWTRNECIICRKNLNHIENESDIENNDLVAILINRNNEENIILKKIYFNICFGLYFIGIVTYFFVKYNH